MSETFPRYQWSLFSPDRSEQIVVRAENFDEFTEAMGLARGVLPKPAFPNDSGNQATPASQSQEDVALCPDHKKPFRYGKFGPFCPTKLPNGTWCKQKPKS